MQKTLLLFLLFPLFAISQNFDGVVHYKDGNTKSGYISISADKIVFRPSKKSKEKTKLNPEKVEKIDLIDRKETRATFFLRQIEKGKSIKTVVVTRLLKGEVSLYLHYEFVMDMNNGGYDKLRYYVAREGESLSKIFPTGIDKSSEKTIKEYFHDCLKLGELIDNKAFEKIIGNNPKLKRSEKIPERLKETVKYYNSKCSKTN